MNEEFPYFNGGSVKKASSTGTGGWIDTPERRTGIQHVSSIATPEDLAQVTIVGTTLRLGDVADVLVGHQPLVGDAVINGKPGVLLVVEKYPWANTMEVTRQIEEALEAMRPGLVGVNLDTEIYRPATFIEKAAGNIDLALLIGLVLVLVVFLGFSSSWRSGLISFVVLLVSVLVAGLVLYLSGGVFNMMVLAGLVVALGAVIDDAVIDVDHIKRRLDQAGDDASKGRLVYEALLEMRSAIAFALLMCLLAVAPIFFMAGVTAALLKPLAGFYALAMVASMGVALTLTPALSMLLLKGTSPAGESVLVRGFRGIYDAVFAGATEKLRTALIVVVVVTVVGVAAFPFLARHSLRPTFKENSLLIDWQGPPGTSYVEMSRVATETGEALRAIPGVRNVSSHVGRAFNGDQVVGINESQLWVNLDPDADYDATVAAIKGVLDGYDGMGELLTYAGKQMMDVERERGTSSDDLVVRVYGHELDILRDKAEEVQRILSGIDGVVNPQVDYPVEEPNVEIEVDLEAAKVHAIKPGEVRRAAAIVLSGHAVGHYYEEQKAYEVVVWGTPETRESVEAIGDLLIDTPSGTVRMDEVAEVRMAPAPVVIKREKVSRYMDVIAQVEGRSRSAIAAEVKSRIEAIDYPLEYHAEVYGAFVGGQAARNRILSLFIAALIGIYLLIQASFGSWRLALVVFLSLPMALAGGVLAAFAVGGLSLGALLGLLAVFAITVRQVQMLIKHYQHLGQQEGFGAALVQRGTRDRLGPILLTTVAIAVLVLPMVFFGNTAGLEIVHPMAVVILGGLVTATVYTFYGVPALYLLFGASAEPDALKL